MALSVEERAAAQARIEEAGQKASKVLERTQGRRVSVLPIDASDQVSDAAEPAQIKSRAQLEYWVENDPTQVLDYLSQMRFERDLALNTIESWEALLEGRDRALELATKAQERNTASKDEVRRLQNQTINQQEELEAQEEAAHAQREELQSMKTKLTNMEIDLERARRDARASPALSTSGSKRSAKFPDPPIFTGEGEPEFEAWYLNMWDKLNANSDHYETESQKAAYVISRTGGPAQSHINSYRIEDPSYFGNSESVFQALKDVYEEADRKRNAQSRYSVLKQGAKDKFAEFFSKFVKEGRIVGLSDAQMKFDLETKIRTALQRNLANHPQHFATLTDLKNYLMQVDNRLRRLDEQKDQEVAAKKDAPRTSERYRPFAPNTAGRTQTYARNTTTTPTAKPPASAAQAQEENKDRENHNCFICHKPGHLAKDCPDRATKGNMTINEILDEGVPGEECRSDSENS